MREEAFFVEWKKINYGCPYLVVETDCAWLFFTDWGRVGDV